MPPAIEIDVVDDLSVEQVVAIEALASAAAPTASASPLNEAALLNLHHRKNGVSHLLAHEHRDLVGYAQLERGEDADTGHLVVAPGSRRRGIGRQLLVGLLGQTAQPVEVWAHGDSAGAAALAASGGLQRVRALSIMTRSLDDPPPEPQLPAGTTIRPFLRGVDEEAWLRVNARAFAHHPEQGRLSRPDLDARMAEPWFDPAGFLLAERGGRVVGFHWTKQHPGRLGEVYVIGVDPDSAAGGIGKALLYAGLWHLLRRGNTEVELYVESDHTAAIGLYRATGFTESSRDVLYRTPPRRVDLR